jgi:hypothetical protein
MGDNLSITPGTGAIAAADEAAYSGDTAKIQIVRLVHVAGAEGSKTVSEVVGASPTGSVAGAIGAAALTVQVPRVLSTSAPIVTAATTNAQNIVARAAVLRGFSFYNAAEYPVYLKFHNTAGSPTPGSGVLLAFGLQAGTGRDWGIPAGGYAFATGIGITVTKGIANNDTTATAASDAVIQLFFE